MLFRSVSQSRYSRSEHLNVEEREVMVFYQTDGLCILFQEDYNTPLGYIDFDLFFTLTPEESFP